MEYVTQNAAARDRVLSLVRGVSDEKLATPIEGGWTVSGLLVHMAFWDRVHVGRLKQAVETGLVAPPVLPEGLTDIINAAGIQGWLAAPGRDAIRRFEEASAEADAFIDQLDEAFVAGVRAAGYPRLFERFRHRGEHGDAIAAAMGRRG